MRLVVVNDLFVTHYLTPPLETSRGSLPKYKGLIDASKKCMRGNGTKFMVISFRSKLSDPSNRIELVRLFSMWATNEFILSKGRSVPTLRGRLHSALCEIKLQNLPQRNEPRKACHQQIVELAIHGALPRPPLLLTPWKQKHNGSTHMLM